MQGEGEIVKGESAIASPPSSEQKTKIIKKKGWPSPEWFKPLEELPGYKHRDHQRAAEVIRLSCGEAGVDMAGVTLAFADYYRLNHIRHGWSDPVKAFRSTIAVQIKLALHSHKPPALRIGMDGKPYRDFDNSHEKYVEAAKTDIG